MFRAAIAFGAPAVLVPVPQRGDNQGPVVPYIRPKQVGRRVVFEVVHMTSREQGMAAAPLRLVKGPKPRLQFFRRGQLEQLIHPSIITGAPGGSMRTQVAQASSPAGWGGVPPPKRLRRDERATGGG